MYERVFSAVRSVWDGELDTLLLWLDDIWASSSDGEGEGLSRTRSYTTTKMIIESESETPTSEKTSFKLPLRRVTPFITKNPAFN